MQVYSYDYTTKLYNGIEYADPDPMRPGEYMFPAYTTFLPPPKLKEFEAAKFDEDRKEWVIIDITPPKPPYDVLRRYYYPSIYDYIDGVVKGDYKQIDKYIERCRKVKEAFPKPNSQLNYEI